MSQRQQFLNPNIILAPPHVVTPMEELRGATTLHKERKALCLTCSDLDHFLFLPAGNAVLTN